MIIKWQQPYSKNLVDYFVITKEDEKNYFGYWINLCQPSNSRKLNKSYLHSRPSLKKLTPVEELKVRLLYD